MSSDVVLAVRGLVKHYPVRGGFFSKRTATISAVNGVDFAVSRKTTLGLVGESGSGKTTVGKCICRLVEPTEGIVEFNGVDICKLAERGMFDVRREMQMVFQDPYASLDPRMTVEQIVGEGLGIHRISRGSERRDRVVDTLRRVGIRPEDMKRHPHEFSGGQRQRVGIARALVLNPRLLIADEPLSALDVSIQAQVINLLMRLREEFGLSYIIISHNLAVIQHMCDTIAVMYLGKIVELAKAEVFFDRPVHYYSQSLLSAVPIPVPGQKRDRIILSGDIPSPAALPSGCYFHGRCPAQKLPECETQEPELKEIREGHFVACHLSGL